MNRKNILFQIFLKNKKIYRIILIVFLIGVFFGTLSFNILDISRKTELAEYSKEIVNGVKELYNNDLQNIFFKSVFNSFKTISIIWLLGCTIIGSYLVYFVLMYRGFKIGFSISVFIYTLGSKNGILFTLMSLFLQNIIYIPLILIISESSIRMCKETLKNKNYIKKELLRHFIILLICLMFSIFSSIVEVYISTNLLKIFKEIF